MYRLLSVRIARNMRLVDEVQAKAAKREDKAPWPWVGEGRWYGDICVPGNTAYLVLGERSLARLAAIAGDAAMTARRNSCTASTSCSADTVARRFRAIPT